MKQVHITKTRLIEAIRKNRDSHKAASEAAFEGYRAEAIKELEDALVRARNKKPFETNTLLRLVVPQDHTSDYDAVISMLEMANEEDIEINEMDFRCYVLDEWEWKNNWSVTNQRYSNRT